MTRICGKRFDGLSFRVELIAIIQQHAEGGLSVRGFLIVLAAILVVAKLVGELAERLGQPAVLGELVAGVLLGGSVFGLVDPSEPVIHLLAEIGVIILLFQIGLETNLKKLVSVGNTSLVVAAVGVAVPFALGYFVARGFGVPELPSIVIGASLTATSVGITARVLSDLGRLRDPEGQVVLGAAVIDDVMGLIILAIVARLVAGETPSLITMTRLSAIAFGFLAIAIVVGRLIALRLFSALSRVGRPESLAMMGLAFAFLMALLAESAGSAMIVGAFAAGLALEPSPQRDSIEHGVVRIGHFFVPIFFVAVGAAVDVRVLLDPKVVAFGASLLGVAIAGKFIAGYSAWWFPGRKAVVGVGMIPRGEVGLIFAQMGLSAAVLDQPLYSAVMIMVMGTTFIAPPLLKRLLTPQARDESKSGVGELVSEA